MQPRIFIALLLSLGLWSRPTQAQAQAPTALPAINQGPELLVDFKAMTPKALQALSKATGLALRYNSEFSDADEDLALVSLNDVNQLERVRALFAGRDDVEGVEVNQIYAAYWTPNDPQFTSQWHMTMVGAEQAWDQARGRGVIVAVIDTGLSTGQGQLKRMEDLDPDGFVAGYDFVNDQAQTDDLNGHGTHVAGTIAQHTGNATGVAGLAGQSKIMPVLVLDRFGRGRVSDIAEAVRWATQHGADVINLSLGGPMPSAVLAKAVAYARAHGVIVVAAAGNSGGRGVGYPAANPGALAVSAVDPKGDLAFYSSWGPQVFISAPGGDTRVDLNNDGIRDGVLQNTIVPGDPSRQGYFPFQGTSMAAPHVAAVAALVISEGITNPNKVKQILSKSATAKGDKQHFGAGLLNAAKAVSRAIWAPGMGRLLSAIFFALIAIFAVRSRKGSLGQQLRPSFVLGLLMGACGLFFWRSLDTWLPGAFVITRPILEWPGALLGWHWHLNVLVGSALVPLALTLLLFSVKSTRALVSGLILGIAAYLLTTGVDASVDVRWLPGMGLLDRIWLVANSLLALVLGTSMLPNRKNDSFV